MTIYQDEWQSYQDVVADYGDRVPPEQDIVYAAYTYEDYSGAAIVVFEKDGKLWEVNDGHCSCYGLEHWEPEETTADALRMRQGWPGLADALESRGL